MGSVAGGRGGRNGGEPRGSGTALEVSCGDVWVPWNGDPHKYIEKFRMLHDFFAKEAPNIAMVWSPGDVPAYSMDPYYPGDDYVDWVGVSLYAEPYGNGDPKDNMTGTSPVERLKLLYDTYSPHKPMMLSETGISHYSHSANESFRDWAVMNLQRLYEVMPSKYPRLKAITYFNVDQGMKEAKNDYMLDDSRPIQDVYSKIIASPYDAATKTVTGRKGDTAVVLVLGDKRVTKNGAELTLEAPAQLINGYTLVPARFVGEAFGGRVEWDGKSRTVRITTK